MPLPNKKAAQKRQNTSSRVHSPKPKKNQPEPSAEKKTTKSYKKSYSKHPKQKPKPVQPKKNEIEKKAGKKKSQPSSASSQKGPQHRIIFANEAGYSIGVIAEDHHLTDFWIEEEHHYDRGISGNIYRGVVSRVLPSLNAAFVNIGLDKDGFLSFSDLGPDHSTRGKSRSQQKGRSNSPLNPGDKILVQMAKEAIADKGPSLTGKISLPGRFVVYMPHADAIRMSRMLSEGEKKRFRELVSKGFSLKGGLIFRTASKGQSIGDVQNDLNYLTRTWKRIQSEFDEGDSAKRIHEELKLFERVLRDHLSNDTGEIVVDHPRLKHRIASFMKVIAPDSKNNDMIQFHTDSSCSVWSKYNLVKDIDQLFTNRIRLDCGGFLIIEEMETLTAIDVNSGKNVAGKNLEQTIVETNVEAAMEISRQLRLRQIGGIIIIDFIDMRLKRNQERVFKTLERELEKDRTPTDMQQFTDLGLIQLTRQRSGESLTKRLTYTCPHCNGSGRRPSILLS